MEEPESNSEQAVLLIERARDSKAPAARAQHLAQALHKLAALPDVQPPKPAGACVAAHTKAILAFGMYDSTNGNSKTMLTVACVSTRSMQRRHSLQLHRTMTQVRHPVLYTWYAYHADV